MSEKFIVHPQYVHLKNDIYAVLKKFSQSGKYIVQKGRNQIKAIEAGGVELNIKKFKNPGFPQSFIYRFFRKSKAERSYEYALRLIDSGIDTPFPVAYYEKFTPGLKESFYVSLQLSYDFDFRDLIHNPLMEDREEILRQFTDFTFKLHENQINFLDHSPGNTLIVKEDESKYRFYLIDLNRMKFEEMDFHKRMKNFRRLWLSKTMIGVIAERYAELYRKDEEEVFNLLTQYSRNFQKSKNRKKIRKRRKRRI